MKETTIYEVKLKFNKEAITEDELKNLLESEFGENHVQKEDVTHVLLELKEDPDMDSDELLDYKLGKLLKGGHLGEVVDYFEVEKE